MACGLMDEGSARRKGSRQRKCAVAGPRREETARSPIFTFVKPKQPRCDAVFFLIRLAWKTHTRIGSGQLALVDGAVPGSIIHPDQCGFQSILKFRQ